MIKLVMKSIVSTLSIIFFILLVAGLAGCSNRFYRTIEKGNESQSRQLIQNGSDINSNSYCMNCYPGGETPLEHAARYGQAGIVKMLIERGARLDGDELIFAAGGGNTDILKLLIAAGDSINNRAGISFALLNALRDKQPNAAELLEESGAKFPSDVATVLIRKNVSVSSVDGNKEIWKSKYNDPPGRHFEKGSFLFLTPGNHKLFINLFQSGTNSAENVVAVEKGSVYILDCEIVNSQRGAKWRPVFGKAR
jgi:Ankyrin repeat